MLLLSLSLAVYTVYPHCRWLHRVSSLSLAVPCILIVTGCTVYPHCHRLYRVSSLSLAVPCILINCYWLYSVSSIVMQKTLLCFIAVNISYNKLKRTDIHAVHVNKIIYIKTKLAYVINFITIE